MKVDKKPNIKIEPQQFDDKLLLDITETMKDQELRCDVPNAETPKNTNMRLLVHDDLLSGNMDDLIIDEVPAIELIDPTPIKSDTNKSPITPLTTSTPLVK